MNARVLTATYRLQLFSKFRFSDAEAIVDYLDELGISHVYSSPYLSAEPGSTHGYNLVDPTRFNAEIGTDQEHRSWTSALAARGMGHIVDVVPNHMGIATAENAWWQDVLENGPSSLFADHFDIEWNPPKEVLKNRILLPILGAQYGEVLENAELSLERRGGAFFIRYYERSLPVSPPSIVPILRAASAALDVPAGDPRRDELESILTGLCHLPSSSTIDPGERRERAREKEISKRRLDALCRESSVRSALDAAVARANGMRGDPKSFDALDGLLLEQCYRLSYWRVATEEINYRRFFDINDLAAVRMEDDRVFADAHALLFRLIRENRLDGLRLDHTDGLYDPAEYFAKIHAQIGEHEPYVVAEKILEPAERLPASWHIHGTTGYDYLAAVNGLFVDPASERAMTELYQELTGDRARFADHAHASKRAIMRASLSSEVNMLAQSLERIAARARRSRDFTLGSLTAAIVETIAAFPVYRTYMRPDGSREPHDEGHVDRAIRMAKRRNPEMSGSIFDFLRDVLLLRGEGLDDADARVRFVTRFQQLTGPVMAKGVEDTAFYLYDRLVSLNEVGGRPDRYGTTIDEFHAQNEGRQRSWPRAMTATSTHDTKRGEDLRARISVLSELPSTWREWVLGWRERADAHTTMLDDERAPTAMDEYLFYQTALGAFPLDERAPLDAYTTRLADYAVKAARESKQRTSWLNPNEAYEAAIRRFIIGMMGDEPFVRELRRASARIATYGASNGIAQTLLKICSPGVPDNYQGSEVWNLCLVDPDNRRPVDYAALRAALASAVRASTSALLERFRDGAIKLFVTQAALRLRREVPALFIEGDYRPLAGGEHVVAFQRARGDDAIVCAATRLPYGLTRGEARWAIGDAWGDAAVEVPAGRYRNVLTGQRLALGSSARASEIFSELPVALLRLEGT